MSIPETFYIALCVTILMLGIVYWFWTQVNYLQRKVNLLDNVVYEMKTFISNLPGSTGGADRSSSQVESVDMGGEGSSDEAEASPVPTVYNAPPESIAGDLEAERLASEIEFEPFSGESAVKSEQEQEQEHEGSGSNDDLQPGGLASSDGDESSKKVAPYSDSAIESPLASMSLTDLRRMAEANNIPGAAEARKRDLIRALRNTVGKIIGSDGGSGADRSSSKTKPAQKAVMEGILSFDDIQAPA